MRHSLTPSPNGRDFPDELDMRRAEVEALRRRIDELERARTLAPSDISASEEVLRLERREPSGTRGIRVMAYVLLRDGAWLVERRLDVVGRAPGAWPYTFARQAEPGGEEQFLLDLLAAGFEIVKADPISIRSLLGCELIEHGGRWRIRKGAH